jgi:hypothetical protein
VVVANPGRKGDLAMIEVLIIASNFGVVIVTALDIRSEESSILKALKRVRPRRAATTA